MTKLKVVVVGKDKDKWISDGSSHYIKLLSRYASIELKIIQTLKNRSSLSPSEIRKKEAQLIVKEFSRGINIALADDGQKMGSAAFSKWLEKLQIQSKGRVTFIIGGAYGLDADVINKADFVISLSDLTFSHQIVRLVLFEQLYRAFSIIHRTDYHK